MSEVQSVQETTETEELFVDIYPCACGHCTECGLNFVPTEEELRRWEEADQGVFQSLEELEAYEHGEGMWD